MNRQDYLEMRKKIIAECEDELRALDKIFARFGGTPVSAHSAFANGNIRPGSGEWTHAISKRDAVRNAIRSLEKAQFTFKDVFAILPVVHPEIAPEIGINQLSAIMSRLADKGEIKQVRPKAGKASAIYEKMPGDVNA